MHCYTVVSTRSTCCNARALSKSHNCQTVWWCWASKTSSVAFESCTFANESEWFEQQHLCSFDSHLEKFENWKQNWDLLCKSTKRRILASSRFSDNMTCREATIRPVCKTPMSPVMAIIMRQGTDFGVWSPKPVFGRVTETSHTHSKYVLYAPYVRSFREVF